MRRWIASRARVISGRLRYQDDRPQTCEPTSIPGSMACVRIRGRQPILMHVRGHAVVAEFQGRIRGDEGWNREGGILCHILLCRGEWLSFQHSSPPSRARGPISNRAEIPATGVSAVRASRTPTPTRTSLRLYFKVGRFRCSFASSAGGLVAVLIRPSPISLEILVAICQRRVASRRRSRVASVGLAWSDPGPPAGFASQTGRDELGLRLDLDASRRPTWGSLSYDSP